MIKTINKGRVHCFIASYKGDSFSTFRVRYILPRKQTQTKNWELRDRKAKT